MRRATCNVRRATCAVLILLAVVVGHAQQAAGPFDIERPILTTGAGPQRLAVDVPLLARGQRVTTIRSTARGEVRAEGGLADLRIYDAAGLEVPYLLVHPSREPQWLPAQAILAVGSTKKTSGFEADLGEIRTIDMVRVDGLQGPFLKRVVLEGSGDRAHWTVLAGEGTLFDLPDERLQQLSTPFAAGAYRYVRVTWDDTNSGRMPLPPSVSARAVTDGTVAYRRLTAPVPFGSRPSEPGRSRYRLQLPAAGLPLVAVTLAVGRGHVFRAASVTEARLEGGYAAPVVLGRGTLARIERDGATAAALRIDISRPREAELEVVVDDGNNPPLELTGVSVEFAELPWIYFEAPDGPLTARYGHRRASAPVYDLEAVRSGLKLAAVPEASWGEPVRASAGIEAPDAPPPSAGAPVDVTAFRHRRTIQVAVAGLSVVALDPAVLAHSRGPAHSFADVRIADSSGRQVPYLLERRDEPIAVPITLRPTTSTVRALRSEPGHNRSVYAVTLPYERLPRSRLVLQTSDRVFQREVQVVAERAADRLHRETWVELAGTVVWQHSEHDVPAPAAVVQLAADTRRELLIVIDEGDNQPLTLTRAELLLPSWRLRFFAPAPSTGGRTLSLLYGQDRLPPPQYDLALLAPQVMGAPAREVTAGEEAPSSGPTPAPFIAPRTFWLGLAVSVLLLLGIIVKLVVSSPAASSPPAPPAP